jgi:phytoene desaturase
MSKRVNVIGAGIAGLAAAIRLRAKGFDVTVYEKNPYPGGKLTEIFAGGYRFDAGPSLFTLPELVTELFRDVGQSAEGRFSYKYKEVACHYFFPEGTWLRAYTSPQRLASEVERVLGVPATRTLAYLEHAARTYDLVGQIFLEKPLNAWSTWFDKNVVRAMSHLAEFDLGLTLHETNVRRLGEPRLVQYFDRMATYNGSSPYLAPGILAMIPHLEHNLGTYVPDGGMIAITNCLVNLAKEIGVTFQLNAPVTKIVVEAERVVAVEVDGKRHNCDLVICNVDVVNAYRRLLPNESAPERILSQERSSSAVIFYWGMSRTYPKLEHHNVFFSADYSGEFDAIFKRKTIFHDPTVYISITSKDHPTDAPLGGENWFVMINAPANIWQDFDAMVAKLRRDVITKLEAQLGEPIEPHIAVEERLDPRSIEDRTASFQGALYGASSNSKWSAFMRQPNVANKPKGLYFCGGSVHPGGGVPLCLMSAKITSALVCEKYVP